MHIHQEARSRPQGQGGGREEHDGAGEGVQRGSQRKRAASEETARGKSQRPIDTSAFLCKYSISVTLIFCEM